MDSVDYNIIFTLQKQIKMDYIRIKNDINGNPRYVFHYLDFLKEGDFTAPSGSTELEAINFIIGMKNTDYAYKIAVKRAKTIGGKKYRGQFFGGGIVFQSYNIYDTIERIKTLTND